RIGLGVMFLFHGLPLLLGGPHKWTQLGAAMPHVGIRHWSLFWGLMAAVAQSFGAVFLILGLFFRPACILLAVTMIVAARMHLLNGEGIKGAAHAIEMAIVFLSLILIGPGKYSLDKN